MICISVKYCTFVAEKGIRGVKSKEQERLVFTLLKPE